MSLIILRLLPILQKLWRERDNVITTTEGGANFWLKSDLDGAYGCADNRHDGCSDTCLVMVAAIIGATFAATIAQCIHAISGWRDCAGVRGISPVSPALFTPLTVVVYICRWPRHRQYLICTDAWSYYLPRLSPTPAVTGFTGRRQKLSVGATCANTTVCWQSQKSFLWLRM